VYQTHLEKQWLKQIYGESDQQLQEITFDIPLSIPYLSNQENFQSVNTTFEKNGKYYRAIKQRYQNDTLQVVAVRDTSLQILDNTITTWISSLVDNDGSSSDSQISFKFFVKDYIPPYIEFFKSLTFELVKPNPNERNTIYHSLFFLLLTPPPQIG